MVALRRWGYFLKEFIARLNKERQEKLEPKRIEYALGVLKEMGLKPTFEEAKCIVFEHKWHTVKYFPYSGWATGKTIQDGRGLENLLKQLK